MEIIKTEKLTKIYEGGEKALDQVSLQIAEGQFTAVVGVSGSGKTTLLNMLAGLDYPTSGEIYIRGNRLNSMTEEELTVFRRRNVGFVFQDFHLLSGLNVYENIMFPLKLDGKKGDQEFVDYMIESFQLTDKIGRLPAQLSGGQRQRVAIARALVTKPAVILADEPTGNLDSKTGIEVAGLLKNCAEQYHQTVVAVTHNEDLAQIADRIIRMEDGKACGEVEIETAQY